MDRKKAKIIRAAFEFYAKGIKPLKTLLTFWRNKVSQQKAARSGTKIE
jgi:hypothetical protein